MRSSPLESALGRPTGKGQTFSQGRWSRFGSCPWAALLVPLGLDGIFWQLMGYGLDWMIAVALWVTSLPGAVGRITAFGVGPLLLGTAGLVVLWAGGCP